MAGVLGAVGYKTNEFVKEANQSPVVTPAKNVSPQSPYVVSQSVVNSSQVQNNNATPVVAFDPTGGGITNISAAPVLNHQSLIDDLQDMVDHFNLQAIGKKGHIEGKNQFSDSYQSQIDSALLLLPETSVSDFQLNNGLYVDGDAGPDTIRKMIEKLKAIQ